jgi:hypothetical protein
MASADERAASGFARPVRPHRQPHILSVEDGFQAHHAADLAIASKEVSHEGGVLLDDVRFSSGTTPPIRRTGVLSSSG